MFVPEESVIGISPAGCVPCGGAKLPRPLERAGHVCCLAEVETLRVVENLVQLVRDSLLEAVSLFGVASLINCVLHLGN